MIIQKKMYNIINKVFGTYFLFSYLIQVGIILSDHDCMYVSDQSLSTCRNVHNIYLQINIYWVFQVKSCKKIQKTKHFFLT